MSDRLYLDWNATAPLCAAAREAMAEAMALAGNPSSVHAEGRAAKGALERARAEVAQVCGAGVQDVVFTSGATEAANWVIRGGLWDRVFHAGVEHDAVRAPAEDAGNAVVSPTDRDGILDLAALESALAANSGERRLVVLQAVNNETGALQPVAEAIRLAHAAEALVMIDAAQAAGRMAFDFRGYGADFAMVSAHKLRGPKGIGALLMRDDFSVLPLIAGGGQEMRRRSGTENLIGALGFGAAATAADFEAWAALAPLRDRIEQAISAAAPEALIFSSGAARAPNVVCYAVPGWEAAAQLMALDMKGAAVSAGSACTSGKVSPSHVIQAMGYDVSTAKRAVRVSLGPTTTAEDVDRFIHLWNDLYARRRDRAA